MNGYELSKRWWDFAFQYTGKRSPTHAALYHWLIEWANRLGWPPSFDMQPQYAMVAIGVKHHITYGEVLSDLCEWGFIEVIRKGANQHAPARLALSKNDKAMQDAIERALSENDKANAVAPSKNDRAKKGGQSRGPSKNDRADDKANPSALSKNDGARDDYTINDEETKTLNQNPSTDDDDNAERGYRIEVVEAEEIGGESNEGDDPELIEFTQKMTGERRLHEALSRHLGIKDADERNRWISEFVFDQWSKDRLKDRQKGYSDLLYHCQSWIKKKIENANQPANPKSGTGTGRPAGRAGQRRTRYVAEGDEDTGDELDRLADEYYST